MQTEVYQWKIKMFFGREMEQREFLGGKIDPMIKVTIGSNSIFTK